MSTQQMLYIVITIGAIALVYMTIKDLMGKKGKKEEETGNSGPATGNSAAVLPLQLQAYERLVLLVDRINPQSLISRLYAPEMTVVDMQISLVHTIKAEFDHNIAQQIYVSPAAWETVKTLKEQIITLINQLSAQLPQDAPARELNVKILEIFLQAGESPSELAAQILNAEAKKIMK
ncbi:hypothetical protein F0L74_26275 [Chitinophaga agrisoli]|uniref:Uncharacterized protein n=1 Tax=Chitinophaga agrisoli TaxID=2607653 RepID=A0A5B2VKT4_9BACT|nr:hypothetical protein [Chitinophaga agrisoli]KAA2239701.1 hypothetical protein F0L74_26275 [Chitinophaga agrisoli]